MGRGVGGGQVGGVGLRGVDGAGGRGALSIQRVSRHHP